MIKYNPSGVFKWAHNFGLPGTKTTDTDPHEIKASNGYLYVAGFFQGTSDFNPWGTPALLTSVGLYDAFIAKYDTNGNYIFANSISGSGNYDNVFGMDLDTADNIYVSGLTNAATLVFDASSPLSSKFSAPGGGGNYDIFIAKYNKNGKYLWGAVMGSKANDQGAAAEVIGNNIYFTGQISNTVDFDPSGKTGNLTSSGYLDAYIAKYDLNGNYVCGIVLGQSTTNDAGHGLTHDNWGRIYACGEFGGITDFDPTSGSYLLGSKGQNDGYLLNYDWTAGKGKIAGTVKGGAFCGSDPARLTLLVSSGGPGPFDVTYTDGVKVFSKTGIKSGVPFELESPDPKTYTVLTVMPGFSASMCAPFASMDFGSATVLRLPTSLHIADSQISCNSFKFQADGNFTSGSWDFGDKKTQSSAIATHSYLDADQYNVIFKGTTADGCLVRDSISVRSGGIVDINLGKDTAFCMGYSLNLHTQKSFTSAVYVWSNGSTKPSIDASETGTYWVHVTDMGGCQNTDTINILTSLRPIVDLGNDTSICAGDSITLSSVNPTVSYRWSNGSSNETITIKERGIYTLTVTNIGCSITDDISVTIIRPPAIDFGNDTTLCNGTTLLLKAETSNSSASWSDGSVQSTLHITDPGIFYAMLTNKCGIAYDTIIVKYESCDIWFPSAFTPNNDGRNDIARLCGNLEKVTRYTLSIFNRYGSTVFMANDVYAGWDGQLNGVPQDLGTYYYYIAYEIGGKKAIMKGDIILLR